MGYRVAAGVNVLVHDAIYTEAAYAPRAGRGHSTSRRAMNLTDETDVDERLFFHDEPTRDDEWVTA